MPGALLLTLYLLSGPALADTLPGGLVPVGASSTVIFDATVWCHFREAKACWGGRASRQPYRAIVVKEIRGMLEACARFWPGDENAPYRMLTLMISETNGHPEGAKPPERSFGPWCLTVEEARESARLFGLPCPRGAGAIRERLIEDPFWAAMLTAGTLWRYDRAQGGDMVRGTLTYKYGSEGLRRAELSMSASGRPITAMPIWLHFGRVLAWVCCLRDHAMLGNRGMPGFPCACEAP